jgi:acetoacetyl-CoA reductase
MARVAVVTGGTRGIGKAISIALRDLDYRVVAIYRSNTSAAREFSEATSIRSCQWDVADFSACQQGIRDIEHELGPIDILVNNAGIVSDATLHRMKPEQWTSVVNTIPRCYRLSRQTS